MKVNDDFSVRCVRLPPPLSHTSSSSPLSVNCCVSLSHSQLAAVNMWLVQSPEPEGTKAPMEPLLAQQRGPDERVALQSYLFERKVCVRL